MPGKARPSLRKKTLLNVLRSNLSATDKNCIASVFEKLNSSNVIEIPCKTVFHIVDKYGLCPMVFAKPIECLRLYEVMNLEFYGYYKTEEEAQKVLKERYQNGK